MSQEYQYNIAEDFFMFSIVWMLSDNIRQRFYLSNVAPRLLFSSALFSGVSRTTLHGVLAVQYCHRTIKTVLLRIFFCENSAQDVEVCGASKTVLYRIYDSVTKTGFHIRLFQEYIKTTLDRIFSSAILPGASWATLPWVFVCSMLSQE